MIDNGQMKHTQNLREQLQDLRDQMLKSPGLFRPGLEQIHANYRDSAVNLLHYLVLRRQDLRPLQQQLAELGLSSLGRAESHVLASINRVLSLLDRISGADVSTASGTDSLDFRQGQQLLSQHTELLLGPAPLQRSVRIMVTMPTEAATDYDLVYRLLQRGMDAMRINCAHDSEREWSGMIQNLRRAEQELDRHCKVVMDLAGPKLRTGEIEPGPEVLKLRPKRNYYGHVTAPARVWLYNEGPAETDGPAVDACIPVPAEWLSLLEENDHIRLVDARGSRRRLHIVSIDPKGVLAECYKTAYIVPGTIIEQRKASRHSYNYTIPPGHLPRQESAIILRPGDTLFLQRHPRPGRHATFASNGALQKPATISCTIPAIFDDIRAGEAIWFDDGKIGGEVIERQQDGVLVRIDHARPQGEKLRSDKGINLPDTRLHLPALTGKDLQDLAFASQHADIVELSFANSVRDVSELQRELARHTEHQPAVVLKVETRRSFENLPAMLLQAMQSPCCGIMIARGDLAVECGFERLAEVQEEILWICEAAHVPVIWATQVLEGLAKNGVPSRAEITDAAMGERAECIMLNKGPHIITAVTTLGNILHRMETHQNKKQSMLRELKLAHLFSDGSTRQQPVTGDVDTRPGQEGED